MSAILFGSISTLADTSELQREAFNQAFEEHDLGWRWGQPEYQELLTSNGGADRIAEYARGRGDEVDARAVHDTKSKLFQDSLSTSTLEVRPGVVETVAAAREAGWQVALVTTTSRANVAALLDGVEGLAESDFDLITDVTSVAEPKPDPAVYLTALEQLGEHAGDCVAVEDNVGGVRSAIDAGITCVAFPNQNTEGHDFGDTEVVDVVSFDLLSEKAGAR